MRIAIIGAGAMGSLFGAILSTVSEVYLIDPFEKHVQTIREKGLAVEKIDGTLQTFHLFVTSDPWEIKDKADLAIIFTKSYGTESAARTAKELLGSEGLALTLQNGLGNLEILEEVLGKDRAIAGVTSHGATLVGPGRVRHAGQGPTYIAGGSGSASSVGEIVEIFGASGIQATLSENLDSLIWGKLVINVGINALAAILRVPNGILGIAPACEKIMAKAVSEAAAVAGALGISLPYGDPLQQVKMVCENTARNRASMLQDILRGGRTEVKVINGAIVQKGKELGIPTPCNAFLSEIIEALEATADDRIGAQQPG